MVTFLPEPHLLDSARGRPWPLYPSPEPSVRHDRLPERPDVVIVGAGPAGLAVTSALWHLGVSDVAVLDRSGPPCRRFFDRIDNLEQRVLRSPYDHHPGLEGYRDCELLDFARLHWSWLTPVERREIRMAQAGHRSVVPVDVFEAFCHHIATVHDVYSRTWQATVHGLTPADDAVAVRTDRGELAARYVVLCLGEERRPAPESWWPEGQPACVSYWEEPVPASAESLIVVGAGLTGAHLVTQALGDGREVHWVMRGEERYQCSDVNASFFRAEGRARFNRVVSWADRLRLMSRERRASVMFEFRPRLREAEASGRLTVHRNRAVDSIACGADQRATVCFADGGRLTRDHVVLALGTEPSVGTGLLPTEVVAPRDGWPTLDERTLAYRNAPRVFAVGASACMVLGPAGRNIDGHRVATARVAATVAAGLAGGTDREVTGRD